MAGRLWVRGGREGRGGRGTFFTSAEEVDTFIADSIAGSQESPFTLVIL